MKALTTPICLLAVAALVLLAAHAGAEEILLNSGSGIEGEIQSVDHESMVVKTDDGETITLLRGAVDPHYYYTEWTERMDKTAENHLRAGVFAFENGLFNQARSQYRKAQKLDKELVTKFEEEIVPKIKEGVARKLLAMAQSAVAEENYRKAETIAAKLLTRLEDTAAAAEARKLIAGVHTWELDKDQERLVKRLAKHLPKDEKKALREKARITDRAAPIEKRIEKAQKQAQDAIGQSSENRKKGIFEQVARTLDGQVKAIDKLINDNNGDEALGDYLMGLREIAVREGVDAHLAAGNIYVARRDFKNAMSQGEAALALDSDSVKAKKFMAETKEASRYDNGWFTTVARGGLGRRR